MMVLGCILEGPSEGKVTPILNSLLIHTISLLRDSSLYVRQSAAWTVSKICEFYFKLLSQPNHFNAVLPVLLEKLQDDNKVACHACWGIINLIENGRDIRLIKQDHFQHILQGLIDSAYRVDA